MNGKVEIYTDSIGGNHELAKTLTASRACAPGGEVWCKVQEFLKHLSHLTVKFSRILKGNGNKILFNDLPSKLFKRCEVGSDMLRINMVHSTEFIALQKIEDGMLYHDNTRVMKSINDVIRDMDAIKHERMYIETKFSPYHQLIDIRARKMTLKCNSTSILKCVSGFNHYAAREKLFNENMSDKCDACREVEMWHHILQCRCNRNNNMVFLEKLSDALGKIKTETVNYKHFLQYIRDYLEGRSSIPGTQSLIGYGNIFRGIIVTEWEFNNEDERKYHCFNKVIVGMCVKYYHACWAKRNIRRHSDDVRRKTVLEWFDREINDPVNLTHPVISIYISRGADYIAKRSVNSIQKWLVSMHTIRKKSKPKQSIDIRSFFQNTL